jgi:multidrug efflux pump subunit AcrB
MVLEADQDVEGSQHMTSLTRLSLGNRMIVGLATLAIIVFGVLATLNLKQELLPSIQVPTAIVTATYPGVSPQIVADDVSTPLEQALSGVSGVTKVESTSTNGTATITVEWEYGLDPDKVVADIRNAVDGVAPTLPEEVETEVLTGSTDDIPVLLLAVASDASLDEAGRQVENVAIPDLSGIDGVRSVTMTGENTTQLLVTLRPSDLRKHDVTAQAVTQTVQGQATITPAGSSFNKNLELSVEVGTSTTTVKQFQALQVPTPDGPVALSAVADVKVDSIESTSLARADGRPALSLAVLKDTDADAVEISHTVAGMIPGIEQKLGNNTKITTIFDQAPLIEQSIHDLTVEGLLGLAFAVLVILAFLFSVRATLITAISIPLSVLIAMIGLQLGEYSLNIFTLAALTVAVGRVVDDSIVVVENIKRRAAGHQTLTTRDILASVKEVAGAVTASTLTTVIVFAPVAIVSGVVGELFRPFAITVALALGASLLVSMTIVPVLAYWLLRGGVSSGQQQAARVAGDEADTAAETESHTAEETKVTRLQRGYLPILRFGLGHPFITLGLALVVFLGTLGSATLLKTDFLGSVTDQTTLAIQQELPPGTRLSTTSAAAEQVENLLRADPQVKSYLTTIGGSLVPGAPRDTNTAEFTVLLVEGARADALRPQLQSQMAELGESAGEITVTMTNNEGTSNDLTVTVSSENTTDLQTGATRIEQELETVSGLTDISSNLEEQRKVLRVSVNKKKAASLGFTQGEVGQAVSGALRGTRVGSVTLSGEQRDILVRSQEADEPSPADIGNLELPVSQLQQQKAQDKAADELADKQEALADEQQRQAEEATADQKAELREQRRDLQNNRSDTVDELRSTRRQLADSRRDLERLRDNPPQPNPTAPPVPVTADALAQQQWQQQVAQQTAAVAQAEQGIEQIEASIEQLDESIDQISEQLDSVDEQAREAEEQREKQEELQDEQEALADVRAKPVKVKDVAKVQEVLAPTTVTQIEGTPSVTITATPEAADLGALTATIQGKLDAITDLPGVTATLGGAADDQREAFNQLGLAMLVAIALVFMIMVGTFRSLLQPLILMVSIPFAATGAVAGLLITDTALGVPAMVGLLMLIGIVVTNAIVLIDLINQYRGRGQDLRSAIIDGARLRLRPIIMTASATIFALIPMALGLTGGGAFISGPLAIVVIGGLVSSTVLTLLLVPVLYSLVERRSERRRLREA